MEAVAPLTGRASKAAMRVHLMRGDLAAAGRSAVAIQDSEAVPVAVHGLAVIAAVPPEGDVDDRCQRRRWNVSSPQTTSLPLGGIGHCRDIGEINDGGDAVALGRHAFTRTALRGRGAGAALLEHLKARATRPLLVGTWKAATWAVRFYEKRGFVLAGEAEKRRLLERYWSIPERQVVESVVLQCSERSEPQP